MVPSSLLQCTVRGAERNCPFAVLTEKIAGIRTRTGKSQNLTDLFARARFNCCIAAGGILLLYDWCLLFGGVFPDLGRPKKRPFSFQVASIKRRVSASGLDPKPSSF